MPGLNNLWIVAPVLLGAQALVVNWIGGTERPPSVPDLAEFPSSFGPWTQIREDPTGDAVRAELGADAILSRTFLRGSPRTLSTVFVAWFQTQRGGARRPHSPKVRFPATGSVLESTGELRIDTTAGPITVNRDIVTQKTNRSVVLYWYQAPRRVTSGEWESKFWIAADALRDRRTDTSLVRIVTWSSAGKDAEATSAAVQLAQDLYPMLRQRLPGF